VKLYVAGPMTGRVDKNRPSFERVQEMLLDAGHDARIPHDFGESLRVSGTGPEVAWKPESDASWQTWMWFDMYYLSMWQPDGVVFLSDWDRSPGARAEAVWFRALRNGNGEIRLFVNANNTFQEVGEGPDGELGDKRIWVFRPEMRGLIEMPQPHLRGADLDFGLVDGSPPFQVRWDGVEANASGPDAPAQIPEP
jgi:hypothetical protein